MVERMRASVLWLRVFVPRTRLRTVASAFTVVSTLQRYFRLLTADTLPLGRKIVINVVLVGNRKLYIRLTALWA